MYPVVLGGAALIEINERLQSRLSPHSCENVAETRVVCYFCTFHAMLSSMQI